MIRIALELRGSAHEPEVTRASVVRTTRKIMEGALHIPPYVLNA
ncbi:MAG: hypothetical protein VW475_01465 [Curvibacter sp.]